MLVDRLVQKAQSHLAIPLRSQQEIDRVPCLVDGLIQILPPAPDPHIGFVHSPTTIGATLARAKGLVLQWHILDPPMVETGMVDLYASFFHHLLELAVTDRTRHIPTHAPKDDLPFKMTAFEIDHCGASRRRLRSPSYLRQGTGHTLSPSQNGGKARRGDLTSGGDRTASASAAAAEAPAAARSSRRLAAGHACGQPVDRGPAPGHPAAHGLGRRSPAPLTHSSPRLRHGVVSPNPRNF